MRWFVELLELVLESAEGAFIEVGVFVGAILLLFALIDYYNQGKLIAFIARSKRYQPVLGALLGLTPGCGGAVFVMPLFFTGSVTFGTVVATLMATMGDAAFVLMASSPVHYLLVSFFSFFVAVITGYVVDKTKIGPNVLRAYLEKLKSPVGQPSIEGGMATMTTDEARVSKPVLYITGGFWVLICIGLVLGIGDLAQVEINELAIPNMGLVIGVLGTLMSLSVMGWGRKHLRRHAGGRTLGSTLVGSFLDTAFIITWVFVGYMAYELIVLGAGGGNYVLGEQVVESLLLSVGVASVFVAVAVGIIPGCGPQIIFVSLFVQGLVPFSALLANAVSQDGDALFPVLAMDRPSAIWATLLNKIPALMLGLTFYWMEKSIDFGGMLNATVDVLMAWFPF